MHNDGLIDLFCPRVSVVMTVYDDLRFLDAAVDSILQQEFRDLELIIVDDGTGDDAIFKALERRDPRIRLVTNPTNLGPAAAANRGIDVAIADIIVRLDADDIAERTRIGSLVAALADDPQLGLVGSAVTFINEAGEPCGTQRMPETDVDIRWTMLFHNPFYHSATAFRRCCFEAAGRYKIDELVSQDHYLWFHMLPLCRAKNIAQPLARYRLNPRGLTAMHSKSARSRTHLIRETLWAYFGLTYDLYDDALAYDITQFLRGEIIPLPARRLAAYRKILFVLHAFLRSPQLLVRGDDAVARRLAHTILMRMLASQPEKLKETFMIWRLCWRIDRRALVDAAMVSLANELSAGWRVAGRLLFWARAN